MPCDHSYLNVCEICGLRTSSQLLIHWGLVEGALKCACLSHNYSLLAVAPSYGANCAPPPLLQRSPQLLVDTADNGGSEMEQQLSSPILATAVVVVNGLSRNINNKP